LEDLKDLVGASGEVSGVAEADAEAFADAGDVEGADDEEALAGTEDVKASACVSCGAATGDNEVTGLDGSGIVAHPAVEAAVSEMLLICMNLPSSGLKANLRLIVYRRALPFGSDLFL